MYNDKLLGCPILWLPVWHQFDCTGLRFKPQMKAYLGLFRGIGNLFHPCLSYSAFWWIHNLICIELTLVRQVIGYGRRTSGRRWWRHQMRVYASGFVYPYSWIVCSVVMILIVTKGCVMCLCREVWPHFRFPALFILPWIEDAPPAVFLTRCTSSPLHTKFYNSDRYSNLNSYVTAYK